MEKLCFSLYDFNIDNFKDLKAKKIIYFLCKSCPAA
jgi:hypothetical protein